MVHLKIVSSLLTFFFLIITSTFWSVLVSPLLTIFFAIWSSWRIGVLLTKRFLIGSTFYPHETGDGKVVVVTGCDSGFGYATSLKLNSLGFTVFATCLDDTKSDLIKKATFSNRIKVVKMDVTSDQDVDQVVKMVSEYPCPLHAVVNNAGVLTAGGLEWTSIDDYRRMLEVNLFGVIRVTQKFLPLLRLTKGRLINLTSIQAEYNVDGLNAYCVSKAAAGKFVEGCQAELVDDFGIKVIDVHPWFFRTPLLTQELISSLTKQTWESATEQVRKDYGLDRFERMAKRLLFMCTDSRNVSDETHRVVDAIIDGVTSPEPDAVYRVISPVFGVIFTIVNDFLPFDLMFAVRRFLGRLPERL